MIRKFLLDLQQYKLPVAYVNIAYSAGHRSRRPRATAEMFVKTLTVLALTAAVANISPANTIQQFCSNLLVDVLHVDPTAVTDCINTVQDACPSPSPSPSSNSALSCLSRTPQYTCPRSVNYNTNSTVALKLARGGCGKNADCTCGPGNCWCGNLKKYKCDPVYCSVSAIAEIELLDPPFNITVYKGLCDCGQYTLNNQLSSSCKC